MGYLQAGSSTVCARMALGPRVLGAVLAVAGPMLAAKAGAAGLNSAGAARSPAIAFMRSPFLGRKAVPSTVSRRSNVSEPYVRAPAMRPTRPWAVTEYVAPAGGGR